MTFLYEKLLYGLMIIETWLDTSKTHSSKGLNLIFSSFLYIFDDSKQRI